MSIKDRIGNEIKVGQHVSVTLSDHTIICEVVEVKNPSMLSAGKDAMQMAGMVVLISKHLIPFDPRQGNFPGMIVCQTPPEMKENKPN